MQLVKAETTQQTLLQVMQFEKNKTELEQKYAEYKKASKDFNKPHFGQLALLYKYASEGYQVVDLVENFKKVSVDANGDPKLCIARVDWPAAYLKKAASGALMFMGALTQNNANKPNSPWQNQTSSVGMPQGMVVLPDGTFPVTLDTYGIRIIHRRQKRIHRELVMATLPLMPPSVFQTLKERKLKEHETYVVWQPEKWSEVIDQSNPVILHNRIKHGASQIQKGIVKTGHAAAKFADELAESFAYSIDPILLHQISFNYFAILKVWLPTPEERKFLKLGLDFSTLTPPEPKTGEVLPPGKTPKALTESVRLDGFPMDDRKRNLPIDGQMGMDAQRASGSVGHAINAGHISINGNMIESSTLVEHLSKMTRYDKVTTAQYDNFVKPEVADEFPGVYSGVGYDVMHNEAQKPKGPYPEWYDVLPVNRYRVPSKSNPLRPVEAQHHHRSSGEYNSVTWHCSTCKELGYNIPAGVPE